jgi:virginiamycin A acetyltransferase
MSHPDGPDPDDPYPLPELKRLVFLKNLISRPEVVVGDYTVFDAHEGVDALVRYHHEVMGDKLIIGKFCCIARGVVFLMNGANHDMTGFSTYPFAVFESGWDKNIPPFMPPNRGDTIVGNDVWMGQGSVVLPGVKIGDGAIVAARSVVMRDVPAYHVVGGNPARSFRARFDEETIRALLEIRWWDWDAAKITRNLPAICGADIDRLRSSE